MKSIISITNILQELAVQNKPEQPIFNKGMKPISNSQLHRKEAFKQWYDHVLSRNRNGKSI